jgi:hypothetical protein
VAVDIETKELGDELMLYHPERDEIHVLNPAARLVYEYHRNGKGLAETVGALRDRFRVAGGQDVHGEAERCLVSLRVKGLIEA